MRQLRHTYTYTYTYIRRGVRTHKAHITAVLLAFLTTRLILAIAIPVSAHATPMPQEPLLYATPHNSLLDGLVRYDSWWYYDIATAGYSLGDIERGTQGTVAFFPLYPLLIRAVANNFGMNIFTAGILTSNIAFLALLSYLYALARREFNHSTAGKVVFYTAAAPASYFFSAMYTESIYLLFVVATFYYAREQAWAKAAVAGALAAATRNTGILMSGVLVLEGLHHVGFRFVPPKGERRTWVAYLWRQRPLLFASPASWAAAAITAVGFVTYLAYLANSFGDPLAFIRVQATWGRDVSTTGITNILSDTITRLNVGTSLWRGQFDPIVALEIAMALIYAGLTGAVLVKMKPSYGFYSLLTYLIPLSTGSVASMNRYVLMLVPCTLLLAHWAEKRPWMHTLILSVSLPLLLLLTIMASHWSFVG